MGDLANPKLVKLAGEANRLHDLIVEGTQTNLQRSIEAGTVLLEAKKIVGYGHWAPGLGRDAERIEGRDCPAWEASMSDQGKPYQQYATQAERKAMLRQDREANTYFDQARLSEALDGAKSTVIGSDPFVRYPIASGPWSGSDNPVEPPINATEMFAVEPCGEAHEIARSLASFPEPSAPVAHHDSDAGLPAAETGSGKAEPSTLRRRKLK
jgi:hypothetical protein